MTIPAAIGAFGSSTKAKISTTPTWSAQYNFFNLTTGASDTDFVVDSTAVITNKAFTVRKADSGLGHVIIMDEDSTELQRLYVINDVVSVLHDGTNFIILE